SNLVLKANTEQMSVEGDAKIENAPVRLMWREAFTDVPEKTLLEIDGAITPAVMTGLGLPGEDYFTGTPQAKVRLIQDQKNQVGISVEADLEKAMLSIAELSARKEAGVPGKLSLKIESKKEGPTHVRDLQAEWKGFKIADGQVQWNKNGNLDSATLKGVRSGRMDADITAVPLKGRDGVELTLTGNTLDFSGYWTKPSKPQ